jgi:hypothetical protein
MTNTQRAIIAVPTTIGASLLAGPLGLAVGLAATWLSARLDRR